MPHSVSIVIPAHNAADTLSATIASVRAQTHPHWEAIIVENGSTDSTAELSRELAARDSRIRAVSSPVKGVSPARNFGLDFARHEWVLFLDADDWILPTHLERLTDCLAADPGLDAAHCGWLRIGPTGEPIGEELGPTEIDLFPRFARTCAITIHSCITRRTLIEAAGRFDPALRTCEDWDLWQRLARLGCRFGAVREALACYRARPGSASMNAAQLVADSRIVIVRGGSIDPRVAFPKPEYAAGLAGLEVEATLLYTVAWAAGLAIGGGRDAVPLLDLIQPAEVALDPAGIAGCVHCCALLPQALPASAWAEHFDALSPLLDRFLDALERRTRQKGLARSARNHLVRLVLDGARRPRPFNLGPLHAAEVEITAPIANRPVPPHVERLHCIVLCEGTKLGVLELPVFDGLLPARVLIDAIAAEFAWTLIGRYFEKQLYPHFSAEKDESGWKLRRGELQLASALPGNGRISWAGVHDQIGWTVFLQEAWGDARRTADQFYLAHPDRAFPASDLATDQPDWLVVELAGELPEDGFVRPRVGARLTVAGTVVVTTRKLAGLGRVSTAEVQSVLTTEAGFELCRVLVREAILGRPLAEALSLRARLALCLANPPAPDTTTAPTSILPRRPGPCGTSVSRLATLPRALVPELRTPPASAEPAHVIYRPDLAGTSAPATREEFFEDLFAHNGNPWHYDTPYEQTKYRQTLSLLPQPRFERVLELACAEGHFTRQLATRADHLLAVDISATALKRAAVRCRGFSNVTFTRLDLARDPLPGRFDLIVCSEVLYFLDDVAALRRVLARIVRALKPGGCFVTSHAHLVVDEPHRSGFDWDLPFGAKTIAENLATLSGIRLERDLRTPMYRVQLYRRQNPVRRWIRPRPAQRILLPQPTSLPPHAEAHALWRGGVPQRLQEPARIVTSRLPIFMYHHVAPEGTAAPRYRVTPAQFEQQLRFLADRGYRSVSLEEWRLAMFARRPLPGRCVAITFDDGYASFRQHAWPLLLNYGYSATMFLPTRYVGGCSEWEEAGGGATPLLDWEEVRELQNQGLEIGSHTHSHPMLTALPPTEIAREALRSANVIESELGRRPTAFAYPYGELDRVIEHVTGASGYIFGVTCESRAALLTDRPLALPRYEVRGDENFSAFVSLLAEIERD